MQITLALVSVLILISTATARRGPGGFQCGPNEERKACGTHCEPTCAVPNPINCPRGCVPNVCQCRIGFIRDSYNNCIRRSACPPNRPNPPNRPYPPNRPGGGSVELIVCYNTVKLIFRVQVVSEVSAASAGVASVEHQ
ncbi:hypothetical protein Y032_0014g2400 [Ancylostoma ceylanicum]|uniref:TIL domain-containing protein n=1 Tax=Ancylostoma ceylanicum TaxID=53326 RepID=A0A016VAE7_9BILA|nr:hypothetical protein Y032_0014g2400 [Ancylostoma ceylanicum]